MTPTPAEVLREVAQFTTIIDEWDNLCAEVRYNHSHPDEPGYNHCDLAPCAWCEETTQKARALRAALASLRGLKVTEGWIKEDVANTVGSTWFSRDKVYGVDLPAVLLTTEAREEGG